MGICTREWVRRSFRLVTLIGKSNIHLFSIFITFKVTIFFYLLPLFWSAITGILVKVVVIKEDYCMDDPKSSIPKIYKC